MSYVQRRANRYEFRYRVPDDLAGRPTPANVPSRLTLLVSGDGKRWKREVVRSLQTNDVKLANRRVLPFIAELQAAIEEARRLVRDGPLEAPLQPEQVLQLAAEHERRIVNGDRAIRRHGIGFSLVDGVSQSDGQGMTDQDIHLYRFVVAHLGDEAVERSVRMRADAALIARMDAALAGAGLQVSPGAPLRRDLEIAFMEAEQRGLATIKARLAGEHAAALAAPPPTSALPSHQQAPTLSAALAAWAQGGGRGAKKPRARTHDEAATAVRLFQELHSDLSITAITKAHAREFRDALARTPKSLPDRLRALPLPALMKRDLSGLSVRSAQTVNKTLNLLSGILSRAEKDGHFDCLPGWSNPFRVGLEIATSERQPYEPFSSDELQRLFDSPVFVKGVRPLGGAGEAAYWFPLIALYSGARRTEIAQLRVSDIRTSSDGTSFFDFNDEGDDKALKNASSARSVPIHPELVRLGLLGYIDDRRQTAGDDASLWPGFEPPVEPRAKAWTKWFGRYLGEYVTESRAKTFHSFRHTFKRACREAGISEEVHNALTGHSGGGVGRSYGRERQDSGVLDRGMSLNKLRTEIAKVSYPVVIRPGQ